MVWNATHELGDGNTFEHTHAFPSRKQASLCARRDCSCGQFTGKLAPLDHGSLHRGLAAGTVAGHCMNSQHLQLGKGCLHQWVVLSVSEAVVTKQRLVCAVPQEEAHNGPAVYSP